MKIALTLFLFMLSPQLAVAGEITRIWLTHKSNDPSKIVVNWMSNERGDSVVRFGLTPDYGETVQIDERTNLHHVEIPLKYRNTKFQGPSILLVAVLHQFGRIWALVWGVGLL